MSNTKRRGWAGAALAVAVVLGCVWFSFGIYTDREFGALHFFRKHQLSSRFFFYSPHGESDTHDKTDAERRAEYDYTQFVEFGGGRERSWTILR